MHYRANREILDPNLPTLLCIPHILVDSCTFRPMIQSPELLGLNVVAVDLRGCGETKSLFGEEYDETKSIETCAAEVVSFMAEVGIKRAFVMEAVVGSLVALHVSLLAPDVVRGLLLGAPFHPFGDTEGLREQLMSYKEAFEAEKADNPDADISEELIEGIYHPIIPQDEPECFLTYEEFAKTMQERYGHGRTVDGPLLQLHYVLGRRPITPQQLAKIAAPTLILMPSEDVRDAVCEGEATRSGTDLQSAMTQSHVEIETVPSNTSCLCMRRASLGHVKRFLDTNIAIACA